MSGFIPPESTAIRLTFWDLGVELYVEPSAATTPPPPPPPIPAVFHRIAERIRDFEHQNERMLCWILYEVDRLIKYAHPDFIDKDDAEALIAEAVHYVRRLVPALTAEELFELERWIDYLPDAYDERERYHDEWDARRQADHERRVAAAKKGIETKRQKREAAKAS